VSCAGPGCHRPLASASADAPASALARSTPAFVPLFNGQGVCSLSCLALLMETAIRRSVGPSDPDVGPYRHRMPIGLLMLSRKWISAPQLSAALALQRRERRGRLGEWLVATGACDEQTVATALASQWGIPLVAGGSPSRQAAGLLPRLLAEAFSILPLRIAAGKLLYLAIDQRVEAGLNLAIESMTGLRVEPVAMPASAFNRLRQRLQKNGYAATRNFRTTSTNSLVHAVLSLADHGPTVSLQLVRVREYFWLRLRQRAKSASQPAGLEDFLFIHTADHL